MITNSCGYQQRFPRLPLSSSTWCVRGGLRINLSLCAIWVLLASFTSVTVQLFGFSCHFCQSCFELIHGSRLAFSQRSSVPRAISWDGNTHIYIHIYIVSIVYDQAISYHTQISCIAGWVDGWMDRQIDRQVDIQTDREISQLGSQVGKQVCMYH